jgi:hypothetical protein
MEIRVLIEMNRTRVLVLHQENNASSSVQSISDSGSEMQLSFFKGGFPLRLLQEKAMHLNWFIQKKKAFFWEETMKPFSGSTGL